MHNETTELQVYLSISGESFDLRNRQRASTRRPTERQNQQTTKKNKTSDLIEHMHVEEHNNRLPFDFERATEREPCRLQENHRGRGHRYEPPNATSPMRDTDGDVVDERHRRRRFAFRRESFQREMIEIERERDEPAKRVTVSFGLSFFDTCP